MTISTVKDLVAFLQTCDQEQPLTLAGQYQTGTEEFTMVVRSPRCISPLTRTFVPNPFVQFMLNLTRDDEYVKQYLEEGDDTERYYIETDLWECYDEWLDRHSDDILQLVSGQRVLGWNTPYFRRTVSYVRAAWLDYKASGIVSAANTAWNIGDEKVREEILGWLATK